MSQPSALESFILTNLDQLSIPYRLERHEAVYTMEDAKRLHLDEGTRPVKNLFLRDSAKKHFFLISLDAEKKLDTRSLRAQLQCSSLSFASEELLWEKLHLKQGAVSPLAISEDLAGEITIVLDNDFKEEELLSFHPGVNTASVFLQFGDLLRYLKSFPNPLLLLPL